MGVVVQYRRLLFYQGNHPLDSLSNRVDSRRLAQLLRDSSEAPQPFVNPPKLVFIHRKEEIGEEYSNFLCARRFFSFSFFPSEVLRQSFKPHCSQTHNTGESDMNMYQCSIWQQ